MPTTTVRNHLCSDASGEQGYYSGPIDESRNLPHGSGGDFRYQNGRRYLGDWKMGTWHGKGQAWFTNGNTYDGEYVADQRHGRGLYRWRDGRIYEGEFANNLRHGQGCLQWLDGSYYEGSFKKGEQSGKGTYVFKGGRYTGEFERGQYHGCGEITWDQGPNIGYKGAFERGQYHGYGEMTWDGRTYKGEWKHGMANGKGIETDHNGHITHQGEWQDDEPIFIKGGAANGDPNGILSEDSESSQHDEQQQLVPVVNVTTTDARGRKGKFRGMLLRGIPHSVGLMMYEDGDVISYQGFWEYGDWMQGRVEYRNGDTFHGDFQNSRRCGTGHYVWADGRQYEGEWKDDRREGQGRFLYPNGEVFEGQFVGGVRHGHGRFQFQDGSIFDGGFSKGEFHGQGCKYEHRDGRIYVGEFSAGVRNGYGKETYPDSSLRYEGEWINDEPLHPGKIKPAPAGFVLLEDDDMADNEGSGSLVSPALLVPSIYIQTKDCKAVVQETVNDVSGVAGTYTGLVLDGLPHGVGRMVYTTEIREGFWKNGHLEGHARAFFQNGDFYEGLFVKSRRHGKGVYKWSDGRVYEGDYNDDQRHGRGRFIYPEGHEYVGDYVNGTRGGKGKFTFSDGSSYTGAWDNNLYHGYGEHKHVTGGYYKGEWQHGMKHGKGKLCTEEGIVQHGEWENDDFVKEIVVESDEAANAPSPVIDDRNTRTGAFHWGALDGENKRWEPVENLTDVGILEKCLDTVDLDADSEVMAEPSSDGKIHNDTTDDTLEEVIEFSDVNPNEAEAAALMTTSKGDDNQNIEDATLALLKESDDEFASQTF